jgi:hypothetical protein
VKSSGGRWNIPFGIGSASGDYGALSALAIQAGENISNFFGSFYDTWFHPNK